jgi:hypothetical protein
MGLLDEVALHDPELVPVLREYVQSYDFDIVLTALNKIDDKEKAEND